MTLAHDFARFCRNACAAPLPPETAERARLCVADHLHAAMHGSRSDTGAMLSRYIGAAASSAESSALFLGAVSTVLEIDDVHQDTSLHTGTTVVPAALCAAGENRVTDERLLAAVALGYEAAIRLSIAAGERHYYYFHSTATCGTVGAAVAAAVVYGLDQEQISHAIGLAVTSASGLWQEISSSAIGVKHLHSGFAAERGIRAAKLARLGVRAAAESIEGEKGFLAALARPHDGAAGETAPDNAALRHMMLGGLGENWAITRNIFKRYPFCLGCFEPLECIRSIWQDTARQPEDLVSVVIAMYPPVASLVGGSAPRTQLEAKFSAAFAVALVLAGHDPEDARLPEKWLTDPAVTRWYPLIQSLPDPTLKSRNARVTLSWSDGSTDTGERLLRSLHAAEVVERFALACREYAGPHAPALERRIAQLGSMADASDLTALTRKATAL